MIKHKWVEPKEKVTYFVNPYPKQTYSGSALDPDYTTKYEQMMKLIEDFNQGPTPEEMKNENISRYWYYLFLNYMWFLHDEVKRLTKEASDKL